MFFLKYIPTVFVVGKEYEIAVTAKKNGSVFLEIGGRRYDEENAGVLSTEKNFFRVRVPQEALNEAKAYTVVFSETIDRKGYFSKMGERQSEDFSFQPLTKTEDIRAYHIADVHYKFELSKKTADYFGADTDLYIVNGDIGEVETEENYFEIVNWLGEIAKGRVPVLFSRGNHDTRGKLAERFGAYFPNENGKFYYTFEVGALCGVVYDCGEDKPDDHPEYGGVNAFAAYREKETAFLESLPKAEGKISFAVGHACPSKPSVRGAGSVFDFNRVQYLRWTDAFEKAGLKFMLCGHLHQVFVMEKNDERCFTPNPIPVVMGSACPKDDFIGTALTFSRESVAVAFTDKDKRVLEKYRLYYESGKIEREEV